MRTLLLIAGCALVAGCGGSILPPYPRGPMLTPNGADVALVDIGGATPSSCRDLGEVRGRGVDFERAVARSGATRELRDAAATLGATHVRVEAERVRPGSHHGWIWRTRDTVTLRGHALRCG